MMECVLKNLIAVSKDGEWGKGEPFDDSVEMLAIRGTDFEDVRFGFTANTPRRHIAKRHADRKLLQPWDVVIEAAGGTKNQITGRTVLLRPQLFSRSELPFTCASFSRFIRFNTELCDPAFMFWYLQHLYASGLMHAYHTQHTGVARFQWTTFSEREPLEIPPLPVQRRIADILSAYDELMENSQRRIRLLEAMARALYREWFVRFRFPGHEKLPRVASPLGDIPQGWEVKKLAAVAEVNRDQINARNAPDELHYIDISSVSPGQIDTTTTYTFADAPGRARRIVQHGDVLWSCVRPNRRSHAQVMHPEPNTIASTGFSVVTATKVPFTFLYFATTTDDFVAYLTNNATGAAYPAVTATTFEKADLLVPPAPLLKMFGDATIPMAEQIHALQHQIQNLRRTRDLLLPRLLSGQIENLVCPTE
jgi:type I restriction enzyme S subunit